MKKIFISTLFTLLLTQNLIAKSITIKQEVISPSSSMITRYSVDQNSSNKKIYTETLVSDQLPSLPQTTSQTSEVLGKAKSYIEQLGLNDISELGTIKLENIS